MGCGTSSISPDHDNLNYLSSRQGYRSTPDDYDQDGNEESVLSKHMMDQDDKLLKSVSNSNDQIEIQLSDPQAYSNSLLEQRERTVNNLSYRSMIESWRPSSLQQLVDLLKSFGKNKSMLERHWAIFLWIASNIEYDTPAYFAGKYGDQSAENVFRTRKGVCAGYGNLYQHLSDELKLPCQIVGGYSKGFGFEDRVDAPTRTDHAWNAVEIDKHWYLVESTWGAGHLTEEKIFESRLDPYYFLPRPDEMVYHHLPENAKWQLIRKPITMNQFMQISHLRPNYFSFHMELVSPRYQTHLELLKGKSYALALVRTPADVYLTADVVIKKSKIPGASLIFFDKRQKLYRCYFAAAGIGKHKITVYAKSGGSDTGVFQGAMDFTLTIDHLPNQMISFPYVWKNFIDLDLEVISPANSHVMEINGGSGCSQVRIRAPGDVALLGRLTNAKGDEVQGGNQIFYDRKRGFWRCIFAPSQEGKYKALILAKHKSDPENYTSAVEFQINAKQIPSPPASFPETWPLFYDYGLQVISPANRESAVWTEDSSYAEVLIQAPDDIQLSCHIQMKDNRIENGSLAQYHHQKKVWQLLFAPERPGLHQLFVFAKPVKDKDGSSIAVVRFSLNVTKLKKPIKFPMLYTQFQTKKCQIITPLEGVLKRGAVIPFQLYLPDALEAAVFIDSEPTENQGFDNGHLRRNVKVGSREVMICGKYHKKSDYSGLVAYSVQ